MPRPNEQAGTLRASIPPEQIPGLIEGLRTSFNSDKTRSKGWRVSQLNALNQLLIEGREQLSQAMYDDVHKSKFEGFMQEIAMCQNEIYETLQELDHWMADEVVGSGLFNAPAKSVIQKDPLGVVLVLGAWNYNVLLSLQPMIGAIAAGNCVVMKPGSYAENSSRVMCELIAKYMDPECILAVEGNREITGALLEQHFDMIFFTGSPFVGKVVAEAAAKHLTPVVLELGGKSPCIVDKTTDLYVAARRIAWGALMNSGQTCVRPDYLMVHEAVADQFIRELKDTMVEFYGQNPKKTEFYGRLINPSAFKRLMKCVEDGRPYLVHGGDFDESEKYIEPSVFDFGRDMNAFANSVLMSDEIFGPLIPIYRFKDLDDEVLPFIRERPKPLALYCFTSDDEFAERMLRLTSSGGAIINDVVVHLSNSLLPFGGVGASGMGSYHGKRSFDSFSHLKAVVKRSTFLDQAARYPPYTSGKQALMNIAFIPAVGYYYNKIGDIVTDKKNIALAAMGAYITNNMFKSKL